MNLLKLPEIAKVADDGAGGYWLHYRKGRISQWFRAAMANLAPVQAMEESDVIAKLAADVASLREHTPSEDMLPIANALTAKLVENTETIERLAYQQKTKAQADKIVRPLHQANAALADWIIQAQPMAIEEEPIEGEE